MKREHVDLICAGREKLAEWRAQNNGNIELDLRSAELQGVKVLGISFDLANLSDARLDRAVLCDCQMPGIEIQGAHFVSGTLKNVRMEKSRLNESDFTGASLSAVGFNGADLRHANFTRATLNDVEMEGAQLQHADFTGATLINVRFKNTSFDQTTFKMAKLTTCSLRACKLQNSNLSRARFFDCDLEQLRILRCDVCRTKFKRSRLNQLTIAKLKGVYRCRELENVSNTQEGYDMGLESCIIPWYAKAFGWENIRKLGQLPLFGLSTFAIVGIPFLMYLIAAYNRIIDLLVETQTRYEKATGVTEIVSTEWAESYHAQMPSLMVLALVSVVSLGFAALLYHLFCPQRIKEFTQEQWTNQNNKQIIQYVPYSWHWWLARHLCAGFYLLGGVTGMIILVIKIPQAFIFVIEHSRY
jgi:uncharacterized protein YjbI with pentapeptide repeats